LNPQEALCKCSAILESIATNPAYRGITGVSHYGLIIIDQTLRNVATNLEAAADALRSGKGRNGVSITRSQVASGLRRMLSDIWDDPEFRPFMKVNLSAEDFHILCCVFSTVSRMAKMIF